ncbi:DUF6233 domain-containing protein, partial [Streptomyces goshikiensis]
MRAEIRELSIGTRRRDRGGVARVHTGACRITNRGKPATRESVLEVLRTVPSAIACPLCRPDSERGLLDGYPQRPPGASVIGGGHQGTTSRPEAANSQPRRRRAAMSQSRVPVVAGRPAQDTATGRGGGGAPPRGAPPPRGPPAGGGGAGGRPPGGRPRGRV